MKSPKGTVSLVSSNGRLQARWRWQGKRYYLSLGVADTPKNRKIAAGVLARIQRDLDYGEFTGDVSKYRPQAVTPTVTPRMPELGELWARYTDFKRPSLSLNTLHKDYAGVAATLERCPYGLGEPVVLRDWLVRNHPPARAKKLLMMLNACCRWALESGLIETNPFDGMTRTIAVPKSERNGHDIDPFTPDERDLIIQGFATSRYYCYYAPLVRFLFLTGCRPSEALALEWEHIQDGVIVFCQTTLNGQANKIKNGLKTQPSRKFPINQQLQALLDTIPRIHKLVFPSPEGKVIDWGGFHRRAWHKVLAAVGVRYRNPYQIRHSFITWALQKGLSVQDVAKLVGNSPEVIYRHYAGASRELQVPEL